MSTLTIFDSVPAQASGETQAAAASRPIPAVLGADLQVPVKGGRLVGYANLDYAASAPCLEPVSAAVAAALPAYSSVHRGAGYASQLTTARYEQARHTVRAFVGARPDDAVIFTRNTTDATNLLAGCLPAGTTTVVFNTEHHASLLPWRKSVRLAPPAFPARPSAPPTRRWPGSRARSCSWSPPRPMSPASCGPSPPWPTSHTGTGPAFWWMRRSSYRIGGST